jgi:hypothetical protein
MFSSCCYVRLYVRQVAPPVFANYIATAMGFAW